jgi:hypothetical protein
MRQFRIQFADGTVEVVTAPTPQHARHEAVSDRVFRGIKNNIVIGLMFARREG